MVDDLPRWKDGESLPPNVLRKKLSSKEAREVGELHLLRDDLRSSYDAMRLYFDRYSDAEPGSDEFVIRMSLFRDSVVQFAGCFSKKEDVKPAPEDVYGHLLGWQPFYQWLHDLRDSYAAHNFGPQRQHDAIASLSLTRKAIGCALSGSGNTRFGSKGRFPKTETRP